MCQVIFHQISRALDYLHSHGIAHRDLKPENVILNPLTPYNSVKVIDFNLSAFQPHNGFLTEPCGNPVYCPPELIRSREPIYDGFKGDIWSAGSTLFVMDQGGIPYNPPQVQGRSDSAVLISFRKRDENELYSYTHRITNPKNRSLVEASTRKDPVQRASARDLVNMLEENMATPPVTDFSRFKTLTICLWL